MSRAVTKAEERRILAESAYWRAWAARFGWHLYGWTLNSATFWDPTRSYTFHVEDLVRQALHALAGATAPEVPAHWNPPEIHPVASKRKPKKARRKSK